MKIVNNGLTIEIGGALGHFPKEFVISSIEKQIPKKVIKVDEYYRVETDEWIADYECAVCGNPYVDDSYCSCCGQKLDWSDTK